MKNSPKPRHWALRVLKWAIIVELVYVVVLNGLLFLPLTQDVLNKIKPEKFYIRWDKAWTFYPARVHVVGGFANGNSRGQMWEFSADRVSGSIALLPLIAKRVWVSNVSAENADFKLRPRQKPDKDYSKIEAFFPEIEGREVTPAVTTPRKKKGPWYISVEDIEVSGEHSYWIFNVQGSTKATIRANLDYESRGGPLMLDVYDLDLALGRHTINGDNEIFKEGSINGSMGFQPFKPRENKGVKMLDYLLVDAEVDIDSRSLAFINIFLLNFRDITVEGAGRVSGRLHFDNGWVKDGTELAIDAENLGLKLMSTRISGDGEVDVVMGPQTNDLMQIRFVYSDLEIQHPEDDRPMLTGQDLVLSIGGNGKLVPDLENINRTRTIGVDIQGLTVPDLALFQRFLPEKWPFLMHGGEGTLKGSGFLSANELEIDLHLVSERADLGLRQYRFDTNLDAALKLSNPDVVSQGTEVGGSYIRLSEAHLKREGDETPGEWGAAFSLESGEFSLLPEDLRTDGDNVIDLLQVLGEREIKEMLGGSSGSFAFTADVSSLAWLGALLNQSYDSQFGGSARIEGEAHLEAGYPQAGTDVHITSDELAVGILDYMSTGDGSIRLQVDEGGEYPDWRLNVELANAEMHHRDSSESYIKDVSMTLATVVQDVSFDLERKRQFDLHFAIPSARVTDMQTFNSWLPPDGPVQFTGGEASLGADIHLKHDDADGWVRLNAPSVQARLDEADVQAALDVNVKISDGVPGDMFFDFSGTEILLDQVSVLGENSNFDGTDWFARFLLKRGEATFTEPPTLSLEADLSMADSRPFVALFDNQGWRPKFLTNAMTVEEIEGHATMKISDGRIIIPDAEVTGDTIEFGAKAIVRENGSTGIIYGRFKKLDAVIRFEDGDKNLDLINALEKYQEYPAPE